MLASEVQWRFFGTRPVHLVAGVLVAAASKFGRRFSNTVDINLVCDTLGCSVKPVQKVVSVMPQFEFEFECGKNLEEIGEEWLQKKVMQKASNVKCTVNDHDNFNTVQTSVRPQFKKSKREELMREKRRIQLKRLQDKNYAAFQRRWQDFLVSA